MIEVKEVSSPSEAPVAVQQAVRHLLSEVDKEFVPSLSCRPDTLSTHRPASGRAISGSTSYFDAMRQESWLIALDSGSVVGLLSFISGHRDLSLVHWSPTAYVTTVAVARPYRQAGLASTLYRKLNLVAVSEGLPYIVTRTWSTNESHIRVLLATGFFEVLRLQDDRAMGIDTLYFGRLVDAPDAIEGNSAP